MTRPICPKCLRPEANDDDWRDVPEGEGAELCWGTYDCTSRALTFADLATLILSIPIQTTGRTTHHYEAGSITGPWVDAVAAMQTRLRP